MNHYPNRRPRKPRPVAEIEADLARVEAAMSERPKNYNANHYGWQRTLRRNFAELRSELIHARQYYGTPPTPQEEPNDHAE